MYSRQCGKTGQKEGLSISQQNRLLAGANCQTFDYKSQLHGSQTSTKSKTKKYRKYCPTFVLEEGAKILTKSQKCHLFQLSR
jgi:hypothetical protein